MLTQKPIFSHDSLLELSSKKFSLIIHRESIEQVLSKLNQRYSKNFVTKKFSVSSSPQKFRERRKIMNIKKNFSKMLLSIYIIWPHIPRSWGGLYSKGLAVLLLIFIGSSMPIQAANYDLPITADRWKKKVFIPRDSQLTQDQAAKLMIENDSSYGACLSIGNWQAGIWNARYQYRDTFPFTTGTLRGLYRTEGVLPQVPAVFVSWYSGGRRLYLQVHNLAQSEQWQSFEIPIRFAYPEADRITFGFGMNSKSSGRVFFTHLSFSDEYTSLDPPPTVHLTRSPTQQRFSAGDMMRLVEDNGVWWLVKPDGSPFYSLATDGPSWEKGHLNTGIAHANKLKSSGFNSLGGWSNLWRWRDANDALVDKGQEPMYLFKSVHSAEMAGSFNYLEDAQGKWIGRSGHHFPDPFDPDFEAAYRNYLSDKTHLFIGKSWFAAWMPDNEMEHEDLYRYVYSSHAGTAFKEFLIERYGIIEELNSIWKTNFSSFNELFEQKPEPKLRTGNMYRDFKIFSRRIVREYARILKKVFREFDPDHMIFTPRFKRSDFPDWVEYIDIYSEFFDATAVNYYPANRQYGLAAECSEQLKEVYLRTGKPILITEWSIPAKDSGLYDNLTNLDFSWNQLVKNQTERAEQAAQVTCGFYNLPFVIGSQWFTWKDYDSPERQANRGLVRSTESIYKELWTPLASAHADIVNHMNGATTNNAPVAVLSAEPVSGTSPLTVNFNAVQSQGTNLSYKWNFGDGGVDTGITVTHTYTDLGNYTATLTVTDSEGKIESERVTISTTKDDLSPSNLTATQISNSQINLQWTDNSNNEDGFIIERTDGSEANLIVTLVDYGSDNTSPTLEPAGSTNSFKIGALQVNDRDETWTEVPDLLNGATRLLCARDDKADSGYDSLYKVNLSIPGTIYAVVSPQYGDDPMNFMDETWEPTEIHAKYSVSRANDFRIWKKDAPAGDLTLGADNSNNKQGACYVFENGAGWTGIATVGANVTSFQNAGLESGKSYTYRVRAFNNVGKSAHSNEVSQKTMLDYQ